MMEKLIFIIRKNPKKPFYESNDLSEEIMYKTDKIEIIETGSKKIIVNLISGGVLKVEEDEFNRYKNDMLFEDEKKKYIDKKMFFNNIEEEQEYISKIRESINKKELSETANFTIMLTFSCNLNCGYCFEKVTFGKKEGNINDNVSKIKAFIDSKIGEGELNNRIALTGGEPLLNENRKYVEDILEYTKKRHLKLHIVTNGTTLIEYADLLKGYDIDFIQVTIDGPEEIHNCRRKIQGGVNCYRRIMEGIEKCNQYNIPVVIRLNADSENIEMIKELDDELSEKFADSNIKGYVYLMKDEGCMDNSMCIAEEKAVEFLLDEKLTFFDLAYHGKQFVERTLGLGESIPMLRFCTASKNQYVLCPDGNIYKCWFGAGDERFAIGNYSNNIINLEKENEWKKRNIINIEKCSSCKYGFLCGGGCANRALKKNSNIMSGNCANFAELLKLAYTKDFVI